MCTCVNVYIVQPPRTRKQPVDGIVCTDKIIVAQGNCDHELSVQIANNTIQMFSSFAHIL